MSMEPRDAELSKLIDDFEYQKAMIPSWLVELVYRLRNSEADIALKLGERIQQLEKELEEARRLLADEEQES